MDKSCVPKLFTPELCTAFANRLAKNLKNRRKWAEKNKYSSYRVYEIDIPELPLIVDFYSEAALVYERFLDELTLESFDPLLLTISQTLKLDLGQIYLKKRRRQKGLSQYQKLADQHRELIVQEGALQFHVNLSDYLDTGLFLDHRPLRQWLAQAKLTGKETLNLFSYTGSLSVALAHAGSQVTSIDMSKTYQAWAVKNFRLNGFKPEDHIFITEDILAWLNQRAKRSKYDLIILDPPSFSNSAKMEKHFDISKDHPMILKALKPLLNSQGYIIFSGNKQRFSLAEELLKDFRATDVTKDSIPSDFRSNKIHFCYVLSPEGVDFSYIRNELYQFR